MIKCWLIKVVLVIQPCGGKSTSRRHIKCHFITNTHRYRGDPSPTHDPKKSKEKKKPSILSNHEIVCTIMAKHRNPPCSDHACNQASKFRSHAPITTYTNLHGQIARIMWSKDLRRARLDNVRIHVPKSYSSHIVICSPPPSFGKPKTSLPPLAHTLRKAHQISHRIITRQLLS